MSRACALVIWRFWWFFIKVGWFVCEGCPASFLQCGRLRLKVDSRLRAETADCALLVGEFFGDDTKSLDDLVEGVFALVFVKKRVGVCDCLV